MLLRVEKIYSGMRDWLGQGMAGAIGGELCTAAVVLLLPTILMGMTFSHLAQGACGKEGGLGRALSINTVGAAIAPFLFGVVLLPTAGLKLALVLGATGYLTLIPIPSAKTQWVASFVPIGLYGLIFFLPQRRLEKVTEHWFPLRIKVLQQHRLVVPSEALRVRFHVSPSIFH